MASPGSTRLAGSCRRSTRARSPSRGRRAPGRPTPARGWSSGSSPRASASGSVRRATRSSPTSSTRCSWPRATTSAVRAAQKVSEGSARSSHDRVTSRRATTTRCRPDWQPTASTSRPAPPGSGLPRRAQEMVDVLFVDEAGQMSLANVLAIARSARSIVLLGDPQQLDQPLQGSHPPGADRSALAHLLDGHDAMPGDARALPRADVATSSIGHRVHLDRLLRGQARVPAEPGGSAAPRPGADARCRCPNGRGGSRWRRQLLRRGGAPGRVARAGPRREPLDVDRQGRRGAPDHATRTSSSSLRTTRRSARSQPFSRPRHAWARSTSSRGRRRRSASTR